MEDSKSKGQDHYDDTIDKNINKKSLEIKNKESSSISSINNELNENKVPKINQIENNIDKGNKKIVEDKTLEENKNVILTAKSNINFDKGDNNIVKSDKEIIKEKTTEDTKLANSETDADKATNKSATLIDKENKEVEKKSEEIKNVLAAKSNANKNNPKEIPTPTPVKAKTKPVKEPRIEKTPFLEFKDLLICNNVSIK